MVKKQTNKENKKSFNLISCMLVQEQYSRFINYFSLPYHFWTAGSSHATVEPIYSAFRILHLILHNHMYVASAKATGI